MNLVLIAGLLAALLGIIHSLLGEKLIFGHWRKSPPDIPRRHYNILWATWHIVSCLGFGIAGVLVWLSAHNDLIASFKPALISLIAGLWLSSLLVLYATRGKHPGWIVLAIIGVLITLSI